MSNVQALAHEASFGTSPTISFTSMRTHENGTANGANPTAGNDIVLGIRATFGGNVTSVVGSDSTSWTLVHADDTNGVYWYRISGIASGVTSFTVNTSADTLIHSFLWEDDEELTPGALTSWVDSGEGSASLTHDWPYTTANSTDLVCGFCHCGGNRQYSALNGSTPLAESTSEFNGGFWDEPGAAETSALGITIDSSGSAGMGTIQVFARGSAALDITADQDEDGDSISASLEVVVEIAATQSETGDSTASSLQVLIEAAASQDEAGDLTASAVQALIEVAASQSETGDSNTAALQNIIQITSSLAEDGDSQAAAFAGLGAINITASQTEDGDTQSARILPPDYTETFFTVDYADLDANSPFAGNATYSDILIGDSCVYEIESTPDAHTVSMTGDGVFSLSPTTLSQNQEVDFYIWDASDETLGSQGTLTIEPAAEADITASQTEGGDTVSATIQVIAQIAVSQPEDGDATAAAVDVLAQISASQAEEGDAATASFVEAAAIVSASQDEDGDVVSAALEGIISLSASLTEQGDVATVNLQTLAQISASQAEDGDAIEADIDTGDIGGVYNVVGSFPTASTVTITLYDPLTLEEVPLDSDVCVEIGSSGGYLWGTSKLTTQPTSYQEYAYVMTDGLSSEAGLIKVFGDTIFDRVAEIHQRFDLNGSNQNTYADDGSEISNDDWTLTKVNNGNGTFTVVRTDN